MGRIFFLAPTKMEEDPVAQLLGVPKGKCVSEAGPITAGSNQLEFFFTGVGSKQARDARPRAIRIAKNRMP